MKQGRPFSKTAYLWMILSGIFAVGLLDYLTGAEIGFFIFYFIPLGFAAWKFGLYPSILLSVLCALIWLAADSITSHAHSNYAVSAWNTLVRYFHYGFFPGKRCLIGRG